MRRLSLLISLMIFGAVLAPPTNENDRGPGDADSRAPASLDPPVTV